MNVGRADLIDFQFDAEKISDAAEIFRSRPRAEWIEFSQRIDCCLEPLLDVREMLEHPQVVARNLIRNTGRVPRMGADTESVLRTCGIEAQEIAGLREAKIIGG